MRQGKPFASLLCGLIASLAVHTACRADSDDWQPIAPEELQMTADEKAPGAPAVYLYRQVDRDDGNAFERTYERIKILTEEGLEYANIEIPFTQRSQSIRNLEARSIAPDGTVTVFSGEVYEKPLLKARDIKLMAKSFTFPNVTVGSIVEYRYRRNLPLGYIFDSRWLLSEQLFTRHARFSLRPSTTYPLRWSWPLGLPGDTAPPARDRGVIRLETRNVPAFVSERFMPPEDIMKFRVDFIYDPENNNSDEVKYWRTVGKRVHSSVQRYASNRRAIETALAATVQADDTAETKLRKIYARVQQIRNTSFDEDKTEQEEKRADLDEARSAADVLSHGYGDRWDITWLFLALVRSAGLEADPILVSRRDQYFFDKRLMNWRHLTGTIVVVKLEGRELYFDPGALYHPYGTLPWYETAVTGLRLDKDGGKWISTPHAERTHSGVARRASLKLTEDGALEGKVTVTYTGLEAAWRRVAERHDDETERKTFLEDEFKYDVPVGVELELTNEPDWTSADKPLVAEYDVKVKGWASTLGKRVLLPVGLFGGGEKHLFEHAGRVHPVYFRFPFRHTDDVSIDLPTGWKVSSLPKGRALDVKVAAYTIFTEHATGGLRLKRDLSHSMLLVPADRYAPVRSFFQEVRAGDEEQAVLLPGS